MTDTDTHTEEVLSSSRHPTSIPAHGPDDQVVHWFPMRVAYDKLLQIDRRLKKLGIEHYLPIEEKAETIAGEVKKVKRPILDDLIFVRSTKDQLTDLKHSAAHCQHLRFTTFVPRSALHIDMTDMEKSEASRIVVIPDAEMTQFLKAVNQTVNHVSLIPYSEAFNHIGRKVRILQGPLSGCVGTLRRIKNNKHVHIDCGGILTAELGFMAKEMYEIIEEK